MPSYASFSRIFLLLALVFAVSFHRSSSLFTSPCITKGSQSCLTVPPRLAMPLDVSRCLGIPLLLSRCLATSLAVTRCLAVPLGASQCLSLIQFAPWTVSCLSLCPPPAEDWPLPVTGRYTAAHRQVLLTGPVFLLDTYSAAQQQRAGRNTPSDDIFIITALRTRNLVWAEMMTKL